MSAILDKVSHLIICFLTTMQMSSPEKGGTRAFIHMRLEDWIGTALVLPNIPLYWFKRYPYKHERDREDLLNSTDLLAMEYFISKRKTNLEHYMLYFFIANFILIRKI